MERHQKVAVAIFVLVVAYTSLSFGFIVALKGNAILMVFLLPILLYRMLGFLSGFGFPEYLARDFGSENHPGPYAVFFWMLYLIACGFVVFGWNVF